MSRNPNRYVAPATRPDPKPLAQLERPALAARIHQLREALELLWTQSDLDGGEPYACIGQMKVCLIALEGELFKRDRAAGRPFAAAVTVPVAESRLRQAGADLSEVIREIAIDGARAMANTAPQAPAVVRELQAQGRRE
jgi:hypothetical protein